MRAPQSFLAALMFYTRLPVPFAGQLSGDDHRTSAVFAPAVGWLVGLLGACVLWAGAALISPLVGAWLAVAALIWVCGAMHEDGLADYCDGLGVASDRQRMLEVMRDSRNGSFGMLALVLCVLGRVGLLAALASAATDAGGLNQPPGSIIHLGLWPVVFCVVLAAHSLSRLNAVSFMATHQYARSDASPKVSGSTHDMTIVGLTMAIILGVAPLVFLATFSWSLALSLLGVAFVVRQWMAHQLNKQLAGYTGDCLGAVQQISELTLYLVAAILLPYATSH